MKILGLFFLWVLLASSAWGGEWVEVAAPGRSGGGVERAVEALVPFDGRIYVSLAAFREGGETALVSLDPAATESREEVAKAGRRLGRFRVLDGKLVVPVAEALEGEGGCWQSAGGGKWERIRAGGAGASFYDAALRDGRLFLAGRLKDSALVAWREGAGDWRLESLNSQAARFSYAACSFLSFSNQLVLLAVRDVVGDWPPQTAPRDWGAWYGLRYHSAGSARGFLFDGPARPLPLLRRLAPGSSLIANPKYAVARDVPWKDGVLFTVLRETDLGRDPSGGLFFAVASDADPGRGPTLDSRRLPGLDKARDVAVAGGRCAVLLGEDVASSGEIRVSTDLVTWETVYEGDFPGIPLSLAVLDGRYYVGLDNGSVIRMNGK